MVSLFASLSLLFLLLLGAAAIAASAMLLQGCAQQTCWALEQQMASDKTISCIRYQMATDGYTMTDDYNNNRWLQSESHYELMYAE